MGCSDDDLRKAYRRQALKYHPDKNQGDEIQARQMFEEVQEAYEILNDPKERRWYDTHRTEILREKNETETDFDESSLFPFIRPHCFDGYAKENPKNFYTIYGELFARIAEIDSFISPSSFGDDKTDPDAVAAYYAAWQGFTTTRTWAWEDKYDPREAPNRYVRRLIEKENQKERASARKTYVDTVKHVVAFARKKDPRFQRWEERKKAEDKKREAEAAEHKRLEAIRKKEAMERKRQELLELQEERSDDEALEAVLEGSYALYGDDSGSSKKQRRKHKKNHKNKQDSDDVLGEEEVAIAPEPEDSEDSDTPQVFYCEVCRKKMKSAPQWRNHEKSKAHQKAVKQLKEELLRDEALMQELMAEAELELGSDSDTSNNQHVEVEEEEEENEENNEGNEQTDVEEVEEVEEECVENEDALEEAMKDQLVLEAVADSDEDANTNGRNGAKKKKRRRAEKKKEPKESDGEKVIGSAGVFTCRGCNFVGNSNSALHKHLRKTGHAKAK